MNNPISPFEKWRLETIPQVGFTPEIRELLAMAFEGGRQSVAEKQEPVAWIVKEHLDNPISALVRTQRPTKECNTPLYLRKEWQSLSDEEIRHLKYEYADYTLYDEGDGVCPEVELEVEDFARAIEQALKEKNCEAPGQTNS